jgi:hypothetical protein
MIEFLATYIIVFMLGMFAIFITVMTVLGFIFWIQDTWFEITYRIKLHKERINQ